MKAKQCVSAILLGVFLCSSASVSVEASWLSKALDKLDKITGTGSSSTTTANSDGTMTLPQRGERWVEVASNKYYKTYIDRTKIVAAGQAQNREVYGVFKREFTPLGSQWLGGFGAVKPNVVTTEYYSMDYGVNRSLNGYAGKYEIPSSYYDVHGNLIYQTYGSIEGHGAGNYIPNSENEQIKDTLFNMFGWDY